VNLKSKKYFDLLTNEFELKLDKLQDKQKQRLGFYLFMLEKICEIKDLSDLANIVTDSEFNQIVFGAEKIDDLGVDAVQIDTENLKINLFNFKFREKFNSDRKQSVNETLISGKFINAIVNENVKNLKGKIKICAEEILEKLASNEIWKMNLYVVSNESHSIDLDESPLNDFKSIYDLEIIPIALKAIKGFMSIRPKPINAKFILESDAVMSYSESSIASSRSYIIRLPISEIVRITSNNVKLRNKYNIEDYGDLAHCEPDLSVLFDNVRGFVLKSKYNQGIEKSLQNDSARFFMYNNGLTITADDIKAVEVNAGKKVKFEIENFQILNGGQTLRTIHKFNGSDPKNISEHLAKGEILVRIFKTVSDGSLINKIAEYTNSQNSISSIDLKSLSYEQIQLEQFLDEHGIIYCRKTGDTGQSGKDYKYKISMERYGQILFSLLGFPEKASNQKKQIFSKYYDLVFGESALNIQKAPDNIRKYFEIKKTYEKNEDGFKVSDQKVFYMLYLEKHLSEEVLSLIQILEKYIKKYSETLENQTSHARILIQSKFKKYLDNKLNIEY